MAPLLRVSDEVAAVAFYKSAFGLEVIERTPLPGAALSILVRNERTHLELAFLVDPDCSEPRDQSHAQLFAPVDDLDTTHRKMKAAGLKPTPKKTINRGSRAFARFFFVTDPDGHRIEVFQRGSETPGTSWL